MVDSGESFAFVFRLFGLGKKREDFNYQFCIFDCGERERSVPCCVWEPLAVCQCQAAASKMASPSSFQILYCGGLLTAENNKPRASCDHTPAGPG